MVIQALEFVCQCLPTVKRLIELHDAVWHCVVERKGGEQS